MREEIKSLFEAMLALRPVMPHAANKRTTLRAIGTIKRKFLPDNKLDKLKDKIGQTMKILI